MMFRVWIAFVLLSCSFLVAEHAGRPTFSEGGISRVGESPLPALLREAADQFRTALEEKRRSFEISFRQAQQTDFGSDPESRDQVVEMLLELKRGIKDEEERVELMRRIFRLYAGSKQLLFNPDLVREFERKVVRLAAMTDARAPLANIPSRAEILKLQQEVVEDLISIEKAIKQLAEEEQKTRRRLPLFRASSIQAR